MSFWLECKKLLHENYIIEENSYRAVGKLIETLRKELKEVHVKMSQTTDAVFVVNNGKAFYTRVPVLQGIQHKPSKFDEMNISTTCKSAARALKAFFKEYPNHTVGMGIGTTEHDMALFISKDIHKYNVIHFEPNPRRTSKITRELVKWLGKNSSLQGYHAPNGNKNGRCTYLAYTELLRFLLKNYDPRQDNILKTFCKPAKTYLSVQETKKFYTEKRQKDNINKKIARLQHLN